jgi:hypothetical protein
MVDLFCAACVTDSITEFQKLSGGECGGQWLSSGIGHEDQLSIVRRSRQEIADS